MTNNFSHQDQVKITQAIMQLLDGWELSGEDIISMLGLTDTRVRHLERYRHETPLPDTRDVMLRVEHLAGIADALRTTYPRNSGMALMWLRRPHRRFRSRPPIQIMLEGGVNGLVRVRSELDCCYAWDRTGTSPETTT